MKVPPPDRSQIHLLLSIVIVLLLALAAASYGDVWQFENSEQSAHRACTAHQAAEAHSKAEFKALVKGNCAAIQGGH